MQHARLFRSDGETGPFDMVATVILPDEAPPDVIVLGTKIFRQRCKLRLEYIEATVFVATVYIDPSSAADKALRRAESSHWVGDARVATTPAPGHVGIVDAATVFRYQLGGADEAPTVFRYQEGGADAACELRGETCDGLIVDDLDDAKPSDQ